jgi:polyisoprenoid-binding protein YceI
LEPGHTAAEFCVRHMMVCYVRGHFKNIRGTLEFDPAAPAKGRVEVEIDAAGLWSGDAERDEHLRSDHFLNVAKFPKITFKSTKVEPTARTEYKVTGELALRGAARPVTLAVRFLGQGRSPFNDTRVGFHAETVLNRHDFGVTWNAEMQDGGPVVGDDVLVTIDAEAILERS